MPVAASTTTDPTSAIAVRSAGVPPPPRAAGWKSAGGARSATAHIVQSAASCRAGTARWSGEGEKSPFSTANMTRTSRNGLVSPPLANATVDTASVAKTRFSGAAAGV